MAVGQTIPREEVSQLVERIDKLSVATNGTTAEKYRQFQNLEELSKTI